MKCSNCNFENRADARFCKQCGQPLPAQPTPPATLPPPGDICPACGATAKPGARFCPRCGKPLAAPPPSPAQPLPMTATQPSMGPLPQPYGQPPTVPSQPKRRPSRWPLLAGGIVAFLCIVAIVAAAWFAFKYLGGEEPPTPTPTTAPTTESLPTEPPPTATPTLLPPPPTLSPEPTTEVSPTLNFDAQVSIAASAPELRVGEILTVTVTVTNTGDVPFGNLSYRLRDWQPFLAPIPPGPEALHEIDIPPGESHTVTFRLEAAQVGATQLFATVTVETREEQPATKPISSEQIVEVSVIE